LAKNANGMFCDVVSGTYKCAWLPSARQGVPGWSACEVMQEAVVPTITSTHVCGVETPQQRWGSIDYWFLLSTTYGSAGGTRCSLSKS